MGYGEIGAKLYGFPGEICGLSLHWFCRTESAENKVFDSHRHTPVVLALRNTVRSPNFATSANLNPA